MSKTKLIDSITKFTDDVTKKQAALVVDTLSVSVQQLLNKDGEVTLPGIGKLKLKERPARTGRNPSTGETVKIAAKTVVKFSSAKALNDAINS